MSRPKRTANQLLKLSLLLLERDLKRIKSSTSLRTSAEMNALATYVKILHGLTMDELNLSRMVSADLSRLSTPELKALVLEHVAKLETSTAAPSAPAAPEPEEGGS